MAFFGIDVERLHDQSLANWMAAAPGLGEQAPAARGADAGSDLGGRPLAELVEAQHRANFAIWRLEDEARRREVPDAHIAALKRSIDPWNQHRNDLMEEIDEAVLGQMAGVDVSRAELHSETAGMMVDRLSILSLKIDNMRRCAASSKDRVLVEECVAKAATLEEQRRDLSRCLEVLVEDFRRGRRFFKRYRQHKAYNDPRLNPALRAEAGGSS